MPNNLCALGTLIRPVQYGKDDMGYEVAYCAICKLRISGGDDGETRLVNYNSQYYCTPCHQVTSSGTLKAVVQPPGAAPAPRRAARRTHRIRASA
jgi:hypothetical protein